MSTDYRTMFVRDMETALAGRLSSDQVGIVSDVAIRILADYEISGRCTDVVPRSDENERLLKRYSACMMVDGKPEGTISGYLRTCRKLTEAIPKLYTEMGAYDIRFFLAMEKERGVSNRTLENTRSYLSAFFQWLLTEEVIRQNPMASIKPIKYADEIREPFSDVEVDALRSACRNTKQRALIEFLLSTGIRVSELADMTVEDVDTRNLTVYVAHGKGDKARVTYTTPVSMKHLLAYLNERTESGPHLFYSARHTPITTSGIEYVLKDIGRRANVSNVHPHRFRRTFATGLSDRGMEIQEIQRLLGHSDISTTMVYVRTQDVKVQASYRRCSA